MALRRHRANGTQMQLRIIDFHLELQNFNFGPMLECVEEINLSFEKFEKGTNLEFVSCG